MLDDTRRGCDTVRASASQRRSTSVHGTGAAPGLALWTMASVRGHQLLASVLHALAQYLGSRPNSAAVASISLETPDGRHIQRELPAYNFPEDGGVLARA